MISTSIYIKAQFYDIDPMNVVWHGHYARFFEQARCQLLDSIDYNYGAMEKSGYIWPIVDMQVRYVRPIKCFQEFIVTATIVEYLNRLKIKYEIADKDTGEVLTKAHTVQLAVKADTGELCIETPAIISQKIEAKI